MSKKEKRLLRLFSIPKPTDFTWDELISVMHAASFKEECQGGSHFTFEHSSGFILKVSRRHPDGLLKTYQIDAVKEALELVGETPNEEK